MIQGLNVLVCCRILLHQLDPSRLVMLALQPGFEDKFASVTDVLGYNYMEPRLIYDKKKYPERICLISESYPYYSSIREFDSRDYDEEKSMELCNGT